MYNKLFGTRTYLVGSMDRVKDGGIEWRKKLTPCLHKLGVMVYNPCEKPVDDPKVREGQDVRDDIERLKAYGKYAEIREKYGSIRNVDLRMVDTSDFLIANIDTDYHACGTYEEIATANKQKKPILIHAEKDIPNWLLWMLPEWSFFKSWNSMLYYLEDINSGSKEDKRWVFFNMEKEVEAINSYADKSK